MACSDSGAEIVERAGYLLYGGVFDVGMLDLGKWNGIRYPESFGLCFAAGLRLDEAQRVTSVGPSGREMAAKTTSALYSQLQVLEKTVSAAAESKGTALRRAPGQPRREYSGCVALWNTASATMVRGIVRNKQVLYVGEFDLSRSGDTRMTPSETPEATAPGVVRPATTLRFDERGGGDVQYLHSSACGTAMVVIPEDDATARREAVVHAVHATIMATEAADRAAIAAGLPGAGKKRKFRPPKSVPVAPRPLEEKETARSGGGGCADVIRSPGGSVDSAADVSSGVAAAAAAAADGAERGVDGSPFQVPSSSAAAYCHQQPPPPQQQQLQQLEQQQQQWAPPPQYHPHDPGQAASYGGGIPAAVPGVPGTAADLGSWQAWRGAEPHWKRPFCEKRAQLELGDSSSCGDESGDGGDYGGGGGRSSGYGREADTEPARTDSAHGSSASWAAASTDAQQPPLQDSAWSAPAIAGGTGRQDFAMWSWKQGAMLPQPQPYAYPPASAGWPPAATSVAASVGSYGVVVVGLGGGEAQLRRGIADADQRLQRLMQDAARLDERVAKAKAEVEQMLQQHRSGP